MNAHTLKQNAIHTTRQLSLSITFCLLVALALAAPCRAQAGKDESPGRERSVNSTSHVAAERAAVIKSASARPHISAAAFRGWERLTAAERGSSSSDS